MANFMPGFNMQATPNMMNSYYNTPSTITGPTGGTSIFDIKKPSQVTQVSQVGQVGQASANPNYTYNQPPYRHPEYPVQSDTRSYTPEPHEEDTYDANNMHHIVEDINDAIKYDKKKRRQKNDTDSDSHEDKYKDKDEDKEDVNESNDDDNKKSIKMRISAFLKEPILLLVLFVILSTNPVKNAIGQYIQSINPDENGVVGIIGIASYGLVLVVLFTIIRYLI
jgi:hypothetical protein